MNGYTIVHSEFMEVDMELAASQLIKLYMQTQVLIGNIYYAPTPEARLLDALNGLSDMGPVKHGRFLELTKVTIQHTTGREEKLDVAYINKSTVQLAGNMSGGVNTGRGIGGLDGPKAYPFVEKSPVPVRIETHDYLVTGNMYHVSYQKIWHVLEDAQIFLPLTHVQVSNRANGIRERIPFAAVNKEHILSLQEEDGHSNLKSEDAKPGNRKNVKK
jgi:hypothetical protein